MPRIAFHTLGCRLNQSETAVIQNTFGTTNYQVVPVEEPADVVVINTCTVTENGDAETRRIVQKVSRLNPQVQVALIGCQAQVQKERLTELSNVRWVVGNARKMELASILSETADKPGAQVITPAISKKPFTLSALAVDTEHTRANIKIQDGCDFFCSFCEIPYARGRARSREFNDILKEAQALADHGYKEVVITGINVGTYNHDGRSILDVVSALEDFSGIQRIRISSIEPTTVPWPLIERMGKISKLCRYLHIPLQSGNDDILKSMQRRYTVSQFSHFIQAAKDTVPELCIGTDVIVGFPGESDAHFDATEEFLREGPIDYMHVFSYSPRYLAKSRKSVEDVSPSVIQKRSRILRDLSLRKRRLFHQSLIGTRQRVLFEHRKDGQWFGLTDNYVRVAINCERTNLRNQLLPVQITEIHYQQVSGILQE